MKKETTRILGLVLFSVILLSLVAVTVSAAAFDPVKDMFTNWQEGQLSVNIAKYLFLALLTILIFSIFKFVPMIKSLNGFVIFLMSLIVSFLATAYVTPQEVYMMLLSYGAMGMILGAVIPLIILVFFTIEMEKEGRGGKIIGLVVWIGFIIFLLYKIYSGLYVTQTLTWVEAGLYGLIVVLSVIFVLAKGYFIKMLLHSEIKDVKNKIFGEIEKENLLREADNERYKTMKRRVMNEE